MDKMLLNTVFRPSSAAGYLWPETVHGALGKVTYSSPIALLSHAWTGHGKETEQPLAETFPYFKDNSY